MNTYGSNNSELGGNLACLTTGPPMQVLTECEDVVTISGPKTEGAIAEASGCELRPRIIPPILQQIVSLPPARIVKILEVREQLVQGTYRLDERLDTAFDRLLTDINT